MVISGLVAVYVLSILSAVHSQSTTVGGNTCPRKLSGSAASDRCSKACSSDANCSGDKRCLCDDVCGMSCVNPSANCPRLELLENGRIEPDENTRVFGTVVTFSCEDGYRVSQNGDSEIHCQGNREWSGTPPTCVIDASCGQPVDFDNARHDGRQNAYDVGDRIVYSCNSGYFRRGLSVSRCLANGQWTPLDLECMPKSCGNPGDIPNARRIGSVFTFPNRVYYECNTGYTLFGREYRSCQTNQQWSNSPPECRPVTCSRQFAPEDGSSFGSRFTYNEEVRFHCNEGYKLVGSEYRTCQADGTWSGAEASCRAINCGPPEPIWNGYIDRDSFGFRTVIIFECNSGAVLVGSRSTYCQEDETWSSPTPKCWKMCVVSAPPTNGFYRGTLRQGTSVVHETTLDIRCRSGYDRSQEESTSCYNGTWQNFPTCDATPCQLLSEPDNGRTNQDRTRTTVPHNTHVTYTCDKGYYLNGGQRICWYGSWTPRDSTTCRARQCPFDTYIEHGSVTFLDANGVRFRTPRANDLIQWTQRKFSCDQGYTLFGDDRNICDEGQWTQNQTVCNPVAPSTNYTGEALATTKDPKITDTRVDAFAIKINNMTIIAPQDKIFIPGGGYALGLEVVLSSLDALREHLHNWTLVVYVTSDDFKIVGNIGEVALHPFHNYVSDNSSATDTLLTANISLAVNLTGIVCKNLTKICVKAEKTGSKSIVSDGNDFSSKKNQCTDVACAGAVTVFVSVAILPMTFVIFIAEILVLELI